MKQRKILFTATIIACIAIIVFFVSSTSYSKGNVELNKVYIQYKVQRGDNLTFITKQMNADYNVLDIYTLDEYIKEVININNIRRDVIYAGDVLFLPVVTSN